MDVLVVGAGAIGCWLTAEIAQTGARVTLVARPRQLDTLKNQGIRCAGEFRVRPQVVAGLSQVDQTCQTVILTMKAFQVEAAIQELVQSKLEFGHLWTLQNGIGSDRYALDALGNERVLAAATTKAVGYPEVGNIEPAPKGGFSLAPFDRPWREGDRPAWLKDFAGGVAYKRDARQMKWSKLLLNMVANASCAITGLGPPELARDPDLFRLELEAVREALAVIKRMGFKPVDLPDFPVRMFSLVSGRLPMAVSQRILAPIIAKARGGKTPSLLGDLQAGRGASEVEYLNGAVVSQAQEFGLPVPVHQTFFELTRDLIAGRLDAAEFHREPRRLLTEVEHRRSQNR